jgi:hypothetical protein
LLFSIGNRSLNMSLISFKLTIDFIQSISKSIAIWHLSKFLIKFNSKLYKKKLESLFYFGHSRIAKLNLHASSRFIFIQFRPLARYE